MHRRSSLRFPQLRRLFFAVAAAVSFFVLSLTPQHPNPSASTQTPWHGDVPVAILPNPRLTPGAINPAVTQANIHSTICVPGYTRTVRPPYEVSNQLKHQVMALYHSAGSIHDYELDHLIPLELGGCPMCIANLWPQPWAPPGANEKDEVESYLRDRVCHHRMTLTEAQRLISTNWYSVYLTINRSGFSTMTNSTTSGDDKNLILHQARSRALNLDQFNQNLITALLDRVTLDQLHAACEAALKSTSPARSFHED